MAKFRFNVDRQCISWIRDVYEVEAESEEEAIEKIENEDCFMDNAGALVEMDVECERNDVPNDTQIVIITSEDTGEEVFNGVQ